jgi:hypothetical protein
MSVSIRVSSLITPVHCITQTEEPNRFTLKIQYRKRFLKDLKALKNQPVYEQILQLAFRDLPNAKSLQD